MMDIIIWYNPRICGEDDFFDELEDAMWFKAGPKGDFTTYSITAEFNGCCIRLVPTDTTARYLRSSICLIPNDTDETIIEEKIKPTCRSNIIGFYDQHNIRKAK